MKFGYLRKLELFSTNKNRYKRVINVYKADGPFVYNKKSYSIRSINVSDLKKYLNDGWCRDIKDIVGLEKGSKGRPKSSRGSDYNHSLHKKSTQSDDE